MKWEASILPLEYCLVKVCNSDINNDYEVFGTNLKLFLSCFC
jgi:hypothetical protein